MILRCLVRPPDGVDVGGRRARVQVEDVTAADAPARVVAATTAPVGEWFEFEVPPAPPGRRWILSAVLQRGRALAAGDLLTTVAIPVPAGAQATLELPLTLI